MKKSKSRFLLQVESAISASRDPIAKACLVLERAAYLVRLGHFVEVEEVLAATHKQYDSKPRVEVSIWLHLTEGLVHHFGDMNVMARDKLRRAHALGAASGIKSLHALSAAWLAHMDYAVLDLNSMAVHLREALKVADHDHHAARSRTGLVVAQAFHLAARFDLAFPWYCRARDHAIAEGDEVTIGALMHNMAWLRMSDLRQTVLGKSTCATSGRHALLGAESTEHFDAMVGTLSLRALTPILRAQILALQGRPAEALSLYEVSLSELTIQGAQRLQGNLWADQAWCRLQVGQRDLAHADAIVAVSKITAQTQMDERAAAHSRLAQIFAELEDATNASHHDKLAKHAWLEHEAIQSQIVDLLSDLI